MSKPTFAITLGDPLGIGPEIIKKALSDPKISRLARWKIFGSNHHKKKIGPHWAGKISWEALNQSVAAVKSGECDGIVTAPVSKTHLQKVGFPYPGQTEFFSSQFQSKKTAMMLHAAKLRVVLTTIHIPLKDVPKKLSSKLILEKITLTWESLLHDFGISHPRLAICGLNPHAGENGLMGYEEKTLIQPAIRSARRKKIIITDPLSADTIFHRAIEGEFDAVICHYHDQGLIPIKTLFFHEGVNTTLGLPIIRTSPDHGPAFDIAGKRKANPSSMKAAMRLAVKMWRNRKLIKNDD